MKGSRRFDAFKKCWQFYWVLCTKLLVVLCELCRVRLAVFVQMVFSHQSEMEGVGRSVWCSYFRTPFFLCITPIKDMWLNVSSCTLHPLFQAFLLSVHLPVKWRPLRGSCIIIHSGWTAGLLEKKKCRNSTCCSWSALISSLPQCFNIRRCFESVRHFLYPLYFSWSFRVLNKPSETGWRCGGVRAGRLVPSTHLSVRLTPVLCCWTWNSSQRDLKLSTLTSLCC